MFRPALLALLFATPALAEYAVYGEVELTGLSREMGWDYNPPGDQNAMVCNVNGPDGFLTVRDAPDIGARPVRRFARLAILRVDTGQRQGHWIRVTGAYRDADKHGRSIPGKEIAVTGWAHDDHLCEFLH